MRPIKKPEKLWTNRESLRARVLARQGKNHVEIARELGRSNNSIRGHLWYIVDNMKYNWKEIKEIVRGTQTGSK